MKINLEETNEEIVKRLGLALKRYTYPDITYYAYNNRNNRNYSYLINNMYHRDNGPAVIKYRDYKYIQKKSIKEKCWYHYGHKTKEVHYFKNGKPSIEKFFMIDNIFRREPLHRIDGPAMVHHYRDGSTKNEYYLYNKKFTEDEYIELFCLYEDMLTNRNLAIMNMKHKFGFIRLRAKEVLDGLL